MSCKRSLADCSFERPTSDVPCRTCRCRLLKSTTSKSTRPIRRTPAADGGTRIMPAEGEAVGDGPLPWQPTRLLGHVVQIAGGIGRAQVDGRMHDAMLDRHDRGDQLDAAAGPEQVADHALGAADRQFV